MSAYTVHCIEYRYLDGTEALDIFVTEKDGTKHHFYVGVAPDYRPREEAKEVNDAS